MTSLQNKKIMIEQKPNKHVSLLPHEVFHKISEAKSVPDRVKILQENESFTMKTILQVNFRDDISFNFPEGPPPYTPDELPPGNQVTTIGNLIRSLKDCVADAKGSDVRKESIFIRMLESVHAKDAEVLVAMKDKTLKKLYKGLTHNTVAKAFPNLVLSVK